MRHKFKVGDLVACTISGQPTITRRIVALRDDGYEWDYPDVPDRTFLSANGTDPEMHWWYLIPKPGDNT